MIWANFLHFYQPPTQKDLWVKRIADECYRPLFRGLFERPGIKLTVNINAVLVELLIKNGYQDVIDNIKVLLERGQIELTGSAKYHSVLAFLPEYEMRRQMSLNDQVLKQHFGDAYKPKGFFPPEMGFSIEVAKAIKAHGYEWVIVDELSFPGKKIDYSKRYVIPEAGGLEVFFRERHMSWAIMSGHVGTEDKLIAELGERLTQPEYMLSAMDGETFGHHRPGLEGLLFEVAEDQRIETSKISDLRSRFDVIEDVNPKPSTWALMSKDMLRDNPFARWKDHGNHVHDLQWELTNLALDVYSEKHQNIENPVEDNLDRALHSDQYWWASARPWWSMEMIELGAHDLWQSVASAHWAEIPEKLAARNLYQNIVLQAFEWQRSGNVDKIARSEDEELRAHHIENTPKLSSKDAEQMIERLEVQLRSVIDSAEFERASVLRDRIQELNEYILKEASKPQI